VTTASAPKRETWKALYAAAARFYALKPWEWMGDSDIFGVRNPADGETGFCCIMGAAGEHFALAVYLGAEGLEVLKKIGLEEVPTDPFSVLLTQKCLMASFEDREILEPEDIEVIRDLGLKFRGRNAWPQFRSYRPGYSPWTVTQAEAEFLTIALDQACEVCPRYRDRPDELGKQNAINGYERFMIRVRTERNGQHMWEDSMESVPPYDPPLILPAPPDSAQLKAVSSRSKRTSLVVDIDFFPMPTAIKEPQDERPWYPTVVLCVDDTSGMILHFEMVRAKEIGAAFAQAFLDFASQSGQLPSKVRVRSEQAQLLLEPVLDELKVPIEVTESLPMIEEAQLSLYSSI
jgi:hypothetical protein